MIELHKTGNPMTIYSVEFSPHCLPYCTQLIKPTSHYHHHNSVVSCRTNDSVSSPRNPPKARVSAEPRPTHLQSHEYKHTHLIKLLNRSYKSGKYNESLYFLECTGSSIQKLLKEQLGLWRFWSHMVNLMCLPIMS
ncbi:hypothetical protein CsSME_00027809 [Camellia sinensis var. sinensis]